MLKYWKLWLGIVAVGAAFLFLLPPDVEVPRPEKKQQSKPLKGKSARANETKIERRMRLQAQQQALREKPAFVFDDDEKLLTAEQKALLESIRTAIDAEDKKKLVKLVQKMQASDEWPDGIPVPIRKAAIEALGWFGAGCLPEIAGFLADGDEEVLEMAVNQYEEALSDPSLSDRERAQIVTLATKVISDEDSLDCMMMEFNNMRHSVAVEAFIDILANGNAAAKAKLPECIEFYTGEEDIQTSDALVQWLKENPDGEDDEDFYGRWDTED